MDEKLQRFANDPALMEAVYKVLLDTYLEAGRIGDTTNQAAAMMAIHNLKDAWRKIEAYKNKSTGTATSSVQIGM